MASSKLNEPDVNNRQPFVIRTKNRVYDELTKETESKWNGPFTFIQAADTQFGLIERYVLKMKDFGWSKEIRYLKLTIQSINSLVPKPKFFVVCGDLVDAFPYSELFDIRDAQIKDLKEVLGELDPEIKMVCVCGNHDVGDIPTRESIDIYKRDFGEDYFSFWSNGCKFISLNSQLYFNSSQVPDLREAQDKWLDEELKNDSQHPWKHLCIFQHIPLFLTDPNEPASDYFNIEPIQRKSLLDRFKKANVSKVFCGHYHRNSGGFDENIEVVVTSAVGAQLGDDKHGYRLVEVNENEIRHKYIAVTDEVN